MRRQTLCVFLSCLCVSITPPRISEAAALRIAPILVEVPRGATTKLRLQNLENRPVDVQIRVFRWLQKGGRDQLVETRDVVASPPYIKLKPGRRNIIRIVRLAKRPVRGEESYRLLIDEIPRRTRTSRANVAVAIRYSLPVFFGATSVSRTNPLTWSAVQKRGKTFVTVQNRGDRRVRLSRLKLRNKAGRTISFGDGLAGYVLARSRATLETKATFRQSRPNEEISITAKTEHGGIRDVAILQTAN